MTCSRLVFREVWLQFCPSFRRYVTLAPLECWMPAGVFCPFRSLCKWAACTSLSLAALHVKLLPGLSASSETHPKPLRHKIRLEKAAFPVRLIIVFENLFTQLAVQLFGCAKCGYLMPKRRLCHKWAVWKMLYQRCFCYGVSYRPK